METKLIRYCPDLCSVYIVGCPTGDDFEIMLSKKDKNILLQFNSTEVTFKTCGRFTVFTEKDYHNAKKDFDITEYSIIKLTSFKGNLRLQIKELENGKKEHTIITDSNIALAHKILRKKS